MFKKPQAWLVLAFIILMFWGLTAYGQSPGGSKSPHAVHLGLSYGVINSGDLISQRLGYSYDDKWVTTYERHGGPDHESANSFTVARSVVFRPEKRFRPFLQIGVCYWDSLLLQPDRNDYRPIVSEKLTYLLGFGIRYKEVLDIGWDHNSTAGRSDINLGIDRIYISFKMKI